LNCSARTEIAALSYLPFCCIANNNGAAIAGIAIELTDRDCDRNFTSRHGVSPGSIPHHLMGVPHSPHPSSYEKSIGATATSELAVMADTFAR
jgi:hypothetical protein